MTIHAARAKIVSIPGFEDSDGSEDDPWDELVKDVQSAKSKAVLLPAPSGMIEGIASSSSASPSFGTLHLKPEVAEDLQTLRSQLADGLNSTFGIMAGIYGGGEATGIREAMRGLHNLVLLPLAGLIEAELSQALDTPVTLDFTRLQLGNLRERASVTKMLVDAGVKQAKALELAGLG